MSYAQAEIMRSLFLLMLGGI